MNEHSTIIEEILYDVLRDDEETLASLEKELADVKARAKLRIDALEANIAPIRERVEALRATFDDEPRVSGASMTREEAV